MSTWKKVTAAICLGMILLSAAGAAGGVYVRFEQGNEARQENKRVWHSVICVIEQAALQDPDKTMAQKRASLKFFDNLLINNVETAPCGLKVTGR